MKIDAASGSRRDRPLGYKLARESYLGAQSLGRALVHHGHLPAPDRLRIRAARLGSDRKAALISPDLSFMYVVVPKAANSTIKRTLWKMAGVELDDGEAMSQLHGGSGPYLGFPDLNGRKIRQVLRAPTTFRFTFVRNPYTRLASAYRQKFLQPQPYETTAYYLRNLRLPLGQTPTFETFLRSIAAQSDDHADIHWMSQTRLMLLHMTAYDFVGRVERFEEEFSKVLLRLNAPLSLLSAEMDTNRYQPGEHDDGPFRAQYTPQLASMVHERYRSDFDQLGYASDSF